eukprot:CAMPEP_0174759746 /NCGR_PEP_ID=MMETSP1094-20130205/108421_1 /TAXON_ID=156173 /ORGANISM="Chrysochromulina brevifilum, Strain UTEX LB 985" /LENGTH=69 /DNA_ID=CAMNT_0015965685 /DNA_START=336 /DNA_END=545 /DNA_ORIENTATION=+
MKQVEAARTLELSGAHEGSRVEAEHCAGRVIGFQHAVDDRLFEHRGSLICGLERLNLMQDSPPEASCDK